MKTTVQYLKHCAIALFLLPVLALVLSSAPLPARSQDDAAPVNYGDTAATYKAKCAICHKANAEKAFDLSKTDEQHVAVTLNGKKMPKPPHMPAYAPKGMTEDQAKAFVAYMRQLRAAAPKNEQ